MHPFHFSPVLTLNSHCLMFSSRLQITKTWHYIFFSITQNAHSHQQWPQDGQWISVRLPRCLTSLNIFLLLSWSGFFLFFFCHGFSSLSLGSLSPKSSTSEVLKKEFSHFHDLKNYFLTSCFFSCLNCYSIAHKLAPNVWNLLES